MSHRKERGFAIGGVLVLILVLGGTLAAFGLIAGGFEDRSTKFWIALGTMLFAEGLAFGLPLTWPAQGEATRRSFPFDFAVLPILGMYLLAVVVLGLLALTPITEAWLGALHVVVGVVALSLVVFHQSAKSYVARSDARDTAAVRTYDEANLFAARIGISSGELDGDGADGIRAEISTLRGELEYAAADSGPAASREDLELLEKLSDLEVYIDGLHGVACGESQGVEVKTRVHRILSVLKRREVAIGMGRR
jgi:hypothetical protein